MFKIVRTIKVSLNLWVLMRSVWVLEHLSDGSSENLSSPSEHDWVPTQKLKSKCVHSFYIVKNHLLLTPPAPFAKFSTILELLIN